MTYAQLKQRLQDWWESSETLLISEIDFFIQQAELRIYRSIDLNDGRKESSAVSLTQGTPIVTLPTDLVTIHTVHYLVGTTRTALLQKDMSFIDDYTGGRTIEGTPRYYAWYDDTSILLGPAPANSVDTLIFSHTYRPTQLSSGNTNTWLSDNAPDVLLYACLLELGTFQKAEPDTMTNYKEHYQQAVQSLLMEENFRNRTDSHRMGEIKVNR